MSAQPNDYTPTDELSHDGAEENGTVVAGTPVEVRRHAGVAALIGAGASAVAIAYLWRAAQTMAPLDWSLCAVMALIGVYYLAMFVDARTPLLVADDLGVRIRLGKDWRGLPWDAVQNVSVRPRRGLLHEGRITLAPDSLGRVLDGLDRRGRRQAAVNQKAYGAALTIPLGLTTRVPGVGEDGLVEELTALAVGRTEVLDLAPEPVVDDTEPQWGEEPAEDRAASWPEAEPEPQPDAEREPQWEPEWEWETSHAPEPQPEHQTDSAPEPAYDEAVVPQGDAPTGRERSGSPRRTLLGGIGTIVSRVAKGRGNDVDAADHDAHALPALDGPEESPAEGPASALPLRSTTHGLRAEVVRDLPASLGNPVVEDLRDHDETPGIPTGTRSLRRDGSIDLVFDAVPGQHDRVRPISAFGEPVEPLVIDDFVTEPAYDPVIGPELAASRNRLGLSVDELADRTRIRPHVIESIEVDDFAPCGGDFYARGHLRTLARVLGKDVAPMLATFEQRYATAPINARRVFEAELATGMTGSMRSTVGGPNWGLLIGVVLVLVLVWGVARLFSSEPAELVQNPVPMVTGSAPLEQPSAAGGTGAPGPSAAAAEPVPVMLTAAFADSVVVVRHGDGRIAFSGEMVLGEKKRLQVSPPVRVRAVDAGAIEVTVRGDDKGAVGVLGERGRRTFR